VANEEMIDEKLEADMGDLLDVVVLGRAARNLSGIKNRQPIGQMYVKADFKLDEFYTDIIADELNVKKVDFTDDVRDFSSYSFKPQLKTVGPKYGKQLGEIREALNSIDGNDAMDEVNATEQLKINLSSGEVILGRDDLLIDIAQKPGYESQSDKGITVVLDTNLSEELLEEGFVREIISKVQTMRKEADFQVMDRITIYVKDNDKVKEVLEKNAENIKAEVLADAIVTDEALGYTKEWSINGENVTLGVKKN
jgi:isoleucyl-tRNA synthetase